MCVIGAGFDFLSAQTVIRREGSSMPESRDAAKTTKNEDGGGSAPLGGANVPKDFSGFIRPYGMNPVDHNFATEVFVEMFTHSSSLLTTEVRAEIQRLAMCWQRARKSELTACELKALRNFALTAAEKIRRARQEGRSLWADPVRAWVHLFDQCLARKAESHRKKKWWQRLQRGMFLGWVGRVTGAKRAG